MTDIKTHLGYARAWVRLCLEKKLLYVHLTTLLSEESLLRYVYQWKYIVMTSFLTVFCYLEICINATLSFVMKMSEICF